jgi:hypothetical protein
MPEPGPHADRTASKAVGRERMLMPNATAAPSAAFVESRIHEWKPVPAVLVDRVLMRDETYWRHDGPRRYYWLLDEGVQLVYEPFGWRGEWYVDVVSFAPRADPEPTYRVTDRYIDLVVEGMGPTYRMLDLDELAEAVAAGALDAPEAGRALVNAQRFVDNYLHRGAPFPPPQIRPHFSAEHRYPPLEAP